MNSSQTVYFALITIVGAVIWFDKLRRRGPLVENRRRDPCPLGFSDVLIFFGGWFVSQFLALVILNQAGIDFSVETGSVEDRAKAILVVSGIQVLVVILCLLRVWFRYRRVSAMGLDARRWRADVRLGVIWFFLIIPPVLLVQMLLSLWIPYSHGTINNLKESQSALPIFAAWFSAVLCAPIVEEVLYRGVLQAWIQRLGNTEFADFGPIIYGGDFSDDKTPRAESEVLVGEALAEKQLYFDSKLRWSPIFVPALLFAALHIGQGAAPIALFLLAIGLGYLYRQTGSIVPGLIVHVLLNLQTIFWVTIHVMMDVS